MNKELEALKELKENVCYFAIGDYAYPRLELIENALKKQERDQPKLKALKIIKKYIPYYIEIETDENGKFIMTDHEHLVQDELTQEEYDLLKEVLL